MQPHPYFDLLRHTDEELEAHFNCPLRERITLHEWPLSCVERLNLADGRRLIYKTQSGPTVEPEFYQTAVSPVLSAIENLHRDQKYACQIMEYLEAPRLWDLHLSDGDHKRVGRELLSSIQGIRGDYPVYLDIHSWQRWLSVMDEMLTALRGLVNSGEYTTVTAQMVTATEKAARLPEVRSVFNRPTGLVHGDLAGDNIFILADGSYRIIDWQRPLLGPVDLDLAHLADSFDLDSRSWVTSGVVKVFHLLRIQWLVECTVRWFPAGKDTYDLAISKFITALT